jgi:hypothetical protein
MKEFLRYITLICWIPVFMGCEARYGVPAKQESALVCFPEEGPSPTFYASSGEVSYKNEALKWVSTKGGSIQLSQVQVTAGAYTDQDLIADCSELCCVSVGGELWLENCSLCGTSQACGNGWIQDSKVFAELTLGEGLHAQNSKFYQTVTVNGNVDAQNTHFEGTLQATAAIIQLDQVCMNQIVICPVGAYYDPQVICLKNHCIVYGDIYFQSSRGKIVLDPTSHIYGNIYGGTIIKPFNYDYDLRSY